MAITKNKFKLISSFMFVLGCFILPLTAKIDHKTAFASDFNYNTSSEIVMEATTKRVLYANNIYEKKYMASTTKILTALVVIENCDLAETVEVSAKTVGIEGSSIYLEAGERAVWRQGYQRRHLLLCLWIPPFARLPHRVCSRP